MSLRIARLFGIDVYVHVSWFVILLVVSVSLAVSVFPALYPWWSTPTTYVVSAIAALLLFASVVVHELAHSVVAQSQGIRVRHITLFLLGGISALEEEPRSPGREAFMAAIGPLSSLAIAGVCLAAAALATLPEAVAAVVVYLGWMNLLLAVFNLLPGFPLDGGRVLRALLWARMHDFVRATRWAARTGHVFGYVLIAGGIVMFFSSPVAGLWTAFIGWVLTQAVAGELRAVGAVTRSGGGERRAHHVGARREHPARDHPRGRRRALLLGRRRPLLPRSGRLGERRRHRVPRRPAAQQTHGVGRRPCP